MVSGVTQPPEAPVKFLSGGPIFPQKSWRAGRGGGARKTFFETIFIKKKAFKKIWQSTKSKKNSHKNVSPYMPKKIGTLGVHVFVQSNHKVARYEKNFIHNY